MPKPNWPPQLQTFNASGALTKPSVPGQVQVQWQMSQQGYWLDPCALDAAADAIVALNNRVPRSPTRDEIVETLIAVLVRGGEEKTC